MYIPQPAKLLFQIDDGWNRLLINRGHTIPEWTKLVIERMLACGPGPWGYAVIAVSLLTAHTPNISVRAAKAKGAAPAA
ncbi:hypothetical protein ACF8NG_00460 [Morganella sp. TYF_6]|jgi:hypothetical protein|uniref:hypothetical protein n=1 Tax=Morganella TaxID=581 RepID=UPI00370B7E26